MSPSLAYLEKKLKDIDKEFPSAKLEGLAFQLTQNESLGLNGHPSDFKVAIPHTKWPVTKGLELPATKFPSALQDAFKDVLKHGTKDKTTCWIDIATLNPAPEFFTESTGGDGKDSVFQAIADVIEKIPHSESPVVRILVGIEGGDHKTREKLWEDSRNRVAQMFWKKEGDKTVRRIEHPNAKLYVGYYGPTFELGTSEASAWLKTLGRSVEQVVKDNAALIQKSTGKPPTTENLDIVGLITEYVKKELPTISWNHAKLLVVNGEVIMTGGGNFWDEYKGSRNDIFDHQVKIKGDAAVTAHKYMDYFFKYLNHIPDTDGRSFLRSISFKDDPELPNWASKTSAPIAKFEPTGTGKYPVLTVGRLGDWHGSMAQIPFPVQVVDAIRDVAVNVLWNSLPDSEKGAKMVKIDHALREDLNALGISLDAFQTLQINPVAWASRLARRVAIEYAEKSVYISQQMIVDTLQIGDGKTQYDEAVKKINAKVAGANQAYVPWDGAIWPYDFLLALGYALSNISKSSDGDAVYIVLTSTDLKQAGWADKRQVSEIKKRLTILMKGMSEHAAIADLPYYGSFIPAEQVDDAIKNHLKFKRIGKNNGAVYCHNKIVCVDQQLLYVGSDNLYPCYNEEHGVWIDDPDTIKSWKETYWDGLWDRFSVDAKD
jgi:hypothetical protein